MILDKISELAVPIFAFYLITFCNFTKELIGCKIQEFLNNNMYGKHIIGFILLVFLVIWSDQSNTEKNLLINLGYSLLIYFMFIITTKLSFPLMVAVLFMLLLVYVVGNISKKRKEEKKEEDKNKKEEYDYLKMINLTLVSLIVIISATGFGIYYVEKKREYGKTFSLEKFIIGVPVCKNYTQKSARII